MPTLSYTFIKNAKTGPNTTEDGNSIQGIIAQPMRQPYLLKEAGEEKVGESGMELSRENMQLPKFEPYQDTMSFCLRQNFR